MRRVESAFEAFGAVQFDDTHALEFRNEDEICGHGRVDIKEC
jgi:hypothetical protein